MSKTLEIPFRMVITYNGEISDIEGIKDYIGYYLNNADDYIDGFSDGVFESISNDDIDVDTLEDIKFIFDL